ncbi:3',5'-cyclic AMP phosphodiesterase CpdA [Pseudaminobacter salicylatoxidans]|uniref:3',5'-cyclic AMP phosphodiesterase CpdA n=2 Tax=Pseudaminobacter salicylatoxidans TaxID=93369 RepID=A0A316C1K9_PSESE|nr:3',5'-cyclic AMP phosphodiesterase CpdA [Pseudaminobacter salicylatoxidans]
MESGDLLLYKRAMFRLAHISDVHLGPLPAVTYRELASKRVVGYVNWQRHRRHFLHDGVIDAIVGDLKGACPDHLAVTGDLVNLALDGEIELARQWLETLGDPRDVSVVPGNHDAYVPGAFDKICRAWGPWMAGDGQADPVGRYTFPYMRVRGRVALIGISTARATAPFMANGFFGNGQARRLAALLDDAAGKGLCRVVMIHHPPVKGAVAQHKRLVGIGRFQQVVARHGAELVLHGHSHLPSLYWIGTAQKPVPVVGVAAAGQGMGGRNPPAQYNLFGIEGEAGQWRVHLERFGLVGAAVLPARIAELELAPHSAQVSLSPH